MNRWINYWSDIPDRISDEIENDRRQWEDIDVDWYEDEGGHIHLGSNGDPNDEYNSENEGENDE